MQHSTHILIPAGRQSGTSGMDKHTGEPDTAIMETMDFGQLMANISEALESNPLAINMCQNLDSPTCPEGWEWTNGALWFQG